MFWGLIMEPNKRYTQTVEKPFHISQAAMDTSTGDNEVCQVMVVVDGKNFLICTLQKNKVIQVPLDLYFKTGNVISFLTNGKCNVHLTGYLDPEFDDEEDGDEEDEEEDEAPELVPAKGKRKLEPSVESKAKKLKEETKKLLKKEVEESDDDEDDDEQEDDDDDEEDSSEGDDDLQKLLDGDADSDDNDDSFRPNSTGADSDESEDEENDTTVNTTSEADTSKEEPKKLSKSQKRRLKKQQQKLEQGGKPQTNGVEKKSKKDKEQPKQKEGKKDSKEGGENKHAGGDVREKKSLSGGVHIEDIKVGSGPVAKAGKEVEVYYEGRLKQNNKMFDSCNKGPGFKFRVGHKEVISGWDVGIAGMKVGGKRKIVCPPAMAYGNKGSPPVIPPNSTLVFEVELKRVK